MRVICVSDLHIAGPDCPRQQSFLRFLADLSCDRLCLCGDVFQHWWHWPQRGARGFQPFDQYRPVVEALSRFQLTVLPGNHDFHAPEFFARLGAEVPGPDGVVRTRWDGQTVVLAHGDQADCSLGYGAACSVLRGSAFRAVVDRMQNDTAWRFLGRLTGHGEVRANPGLITRQHAWAHAQGADLVVYGHTHAPEVVHVAGRTVVNIGDGVTHGTFVDFDSARPVAEVVALREFASPLQDRA